MKSATSYIGSFIFTLLLVFSIIASVGCFTADKFATEQSLINLAEENKISSIVHKEIEKHFTQKYADSGIPAEVYMNSISDEYLRIVIKQKISYGFAELNGQDSSGFKDIPENNELDNSISAYFEEYAEKTGYEIKDENDKYYSKLAAARKNAKTAIEEYCDIFKFNALVKHGIIKKIRPVFIKLETIKIICIGISAFLTLILLVCNFKRIKDALYWIGTGLLCAGLLGAAPCIYLLKTDYFSSFTIKQAQIYTSYTTAMTSFTENVLFAFVGLIAAAGAVYILYGIVSAFSKKESLEKANVKS